MLWKRAGKYGLAAVNYEIVLAGTWHNRFRQELKVVAQEEYAHMMQEAIRSQKVSRSLANQFGERLEQMARPQPKSDLRVTISWNTDATDIDLWVIEPDGTKCFYSHNRTASGGELSQDQTQGYGPERYQIAKAQPGVYTIIVHYFGVNPNLLGGETHVSVNVTRFAGTPKETSQRHTVILKQTRRTGGGLQDQVLTTRRFPCRRRPPARSDCSAAEDGGIIFRPFLFYPLSRRGQDSNRQSMDRLPLILFVLVA